MIKELGAIGEYNSETFEMPFGYEYVFIVPDGIKSLMADIGYGIEISKGTSFSEVMESGPRNVGYEECKKEAVALFSHVFKEELEKYIDTLYGITKNEENE